MISVKIYFSFSFCSDINLEGTVVKAGKIRDLISPPNTTKKKKNEKKKTQNNNYCISYQKNHIKK